MIYLFIDFNVLYDDGGEIKVGDGRKGGRGRGMTLGGDSGLMVQRKADYFLVLMTNNILLENVQKLT